MAVQTFSVPPGVDSRAIVAAAKPGDTVVFQSGQHRRVKAFGLAGLPGAPVVLNFESGAEITAEGNAGADPGTGEGINLEGCHHVTVQGATVKGMVAGVRGNIAGIRAVEGSNITVRDCWVSGCKDFGVFFGFVDDALVEDCLVELSQRQHGLYFSNSFRNATARRVKSRFNHACGIHVNGDRRTGSATGKPVTGIAENVRLENCTAHDNGAGGGAAYNLDGVDGAVLLECVAYGNRGAALAMFQADGAIPTTRVTTVRCDLRNPSGSRATVMVRDGAGPWVSWNSRYEHADAYRPEVVCPPEMYEKGDYNCFTRWHPDDDASARTLAEWKKATGQDANSVPNPGPLPVVPDGIPDPVASLPKYAARDLTVVLPAVVVMATDTPVKAVAFNAGTEKWARGGLVKVGTPDNSDTHGFSRLLLEEEEVNPGSVGTFAGVVNTMAAGPLTLRMVAEGVKWFGPTVSTPFRLAPTITRAEVAAIDRAIGDIMRRLDKLEAGGVSPPPPPPAAADYAFEVIGVSGATGEPGKQALASATVQNVGRLKWTAGGDVKFGIVNPRDDGRFGAGRLELTEDVEPGEAGIFAAYLTVQPADDVFRAAPVKEFDRWFDRPAVDVPVRVAR